MASAPTGVPTRGTPEYTQYLIQLGRKKRAQAGVSPPETESPQGFQGPWAGVAQSVATPAIAAGNTIRAGASGSLWLLQQMGLRQHAGTAGLMAPSVELFTTPGTVKEKVIQGLTGTPRAIAGLYKGVVNLETPTGGKPEEAVADVLRKAGWTEGVKTQYPEMMDLTLSALQGLGGPAGAGANIIQHGPQALEYMTGPRGGALAADIIGGEGVNLAAKGVGRLAQFAKVPEAASAVRDTAMKVKPIRRTFEAASYMGGVGRKVMNPITRHFTSTDAREEMRTAVREMAGERGAQIAQHQEQTAGGIQAIEEGHKTFALTPEQRAQHARDVQEAIQNETPIPHAYLGENAQDREKYLEVIREHSNKSGAGGRFKYDPYVKQGLITPGEGDWLLRHDELLSQSIPASRTGAGLVRQTLGAASHRAAEKFSDAMTRVKSLRDEAMAHLTRQSPERHFLDVEGTPRSFPKGTIGALPQSGDLNELRKKLAKAIMDADYAKRLFVRVSHHKMTIGDYNPKKLFDYTLDELVGLSESLTAQEARGLGRVGFSSALAPKNLVGRNPVKIVVRSKFPGKTPADQGPLIARVFDRHADEVWRSGEHANPDDALREASRVWGPGTEFEVQARPWSSDKRIRGLRKSPIAHLERAANEISDRDKYFVNYLPRYESAETLAKTAKFRAGKKTGVSTTVGGARIASPTTTQEEARQLVRDRVAKDAAEANLSGKATELKEPLQSLTEALETHIRRNADAVSKARLLGKVAQKFGVRALEPGQASILEHEGWKQLKKLKGASSGAGGYLTEQLESYVPESVFDGLDALSRALEPKTRRGFAGFFHKVLGAEKTYLTVLNPRFSIRNRVWEVMASYARGNANPKNWTDANKLTAGAYNGVKVPGFDMTGEELIRLLRREGVLGAEAGLSGEYMTSSGRVVKGPLERNLKGVGQAVGRAAEAGLEQAGRFNQSGEARARVAHWLWARRDGGMNLARARREVATAIFDYGLDFHTVAEAQLREWIPFYTWYRNIGRLLLRTMIERPGELSKIGAIATTSNAEQGVSPQDTEHLGRGYMGTVPLVLPDAQTQVPGTKRVAQLPFGFSDPGSFLQTSEELEGSTPLGRFTAGAQAVANVTRPEANLLISLVLAKSMSGEEFTGKIKRLPSTAYIIPEKFREQLKIQEKGGVLFGPATLIPLLRYVGGGPVEGITSFTAQNPRAQAKGMGWITGVPVDPMVPLEENRRMAIRMRRLRKQEARRMKHSGRAGMRRALREMQGIQPEEDTGE